MVVAGDRVRGPSVREHLSGVMPKFIAVRRMKPMITDTTTEKTIPRGADVDASWVSSDMCAEAS